MEYYQITDGEWITPQMKKFYDSCCDCGLVHVTDFRIKDGQLQFRTTRNNRSTAMMRRHKKVKVVKVRKRKNG